MKAIGIFSRKSLFTIFLFISFSFTLNAQNEKSRIEKVENGLRPNSWALFSDDKGVSILERLKFYNVPGVSIAVIENNKVVWAKAYGYKDADTKEPVTITTMFQAASISKTFNATVIMKNVEKGILVLDQDINKYLKTWQLPSNQFTEKKKVTLSHLLSHTGGTTVSGFPGYKITDPKPTLLQILKGEAPANTPAIVVDKEPGKSFRYSGGGTTILQLLVTELYNKPYPQIIKENVLDPLGMKNSTFMQPLPDNLRKFAATAHDGQGKPIEGKYNVYPEMAAAGLWTTPTDLANYIIEHRLSLFGKSNKILTKESEEKMVTPFLPGSRYGQGFSLPYKGSEIYFGHSGGNVGFLSDMIINKESGYGAVVMINGSNGAILNEIYNSIAKEYGWKNFLPQMIEVTSVAPEKMKRFIGRYYISEDDVLEIKEKDGKFTIQNPDRGVMNISTLSDEEFVNKAQPYRYKLFKGKEIKDDTLLISLSGSITKADRLPDDKMIPYEYLNAGKIEQAVKLYNEIKLKDATSSAVREARINTFGYGFLRQDKINEAIVLFKLNTEWYPKSANAFDSLGEAYMKKGDKKFAIECFEKVLEINPKNSNAINVLKELRK